MNIYIIFSLTVLVLGLTIFLLARKLVNNKEEIKGIRLNALNEVAAAKKSCDEDKQHLIEEHNKATEVIKVECNQKIQDTIEKCNQKIQDTLEFIENRKEKLSQKSEKELLADAVFSLSGYASRLDRLEALLKDDKTEKQIEKMRSDFSSQFGSITSSVKKINNRVDSLSSTVEDISSTCNDYLYLKSDVDSLQSDVDSLQSNVDSLQSNVDSLQSDIDSLQSDVDNNSSNYNDYSSLESDVESLRSSVDSLASTVDDIKYSIES